MGTRGAFGFYKEGVDKLTYNHYDSYPDGLGEDIVKVLRKTSIQELNEIFDRIELVGDKEPTQEQIEHCKPWTNLGVSEQSEKDWYCLLREAQGELQAYKDGLRYMKDGKGFMADSLFNEWSYVINLDENLFEVYVGFNDKNHETRYSIEKPSSSGYYAVRLLTTFPLDNIPEDWEQQVYKLAE